MNKKLDMLFVHPPANISEQSHTLDADVAYTEQFVALPMGFFNMADKLDKAGFKVRIVNLGERVYSHAEPLPQLVANIILEYKPKIIGMDIHWMIHAAGAIETARLIKEYAPDTTVVLGGISASYFFAEILNNYPAVDYVMMGECDDAIVDLVREITTAHPALAQVPNLAYRANGGVVANPVIVPNISQDIELTRYDLLVDQPVINPDRALISFFRGCLNNCDFCAGSRTAFGHIMKRAKTGVIDPAVLVGLMQKNLDKGRDKIYLYGDIRLCGREYVDRFFSELASSNIRGAHIVFEFFDQLATEVYIRRWSEWAKCKGNTLEATHSPDDGNREIRMRYGKGYLNEQLLEHCRLVASYDVPQSIYFLLGLPGQTKRTIEETLDLADAIVEIYAYKFSKANLRHEVVAYNFMQIPDAGSNLYRNPERYGFHLNFNGIEGLIKKLSGATHWSEVVGYHTDDLSKGDLIRQFYHIQKSLLRIYHAHHLISGAELQARIDKYERDEKKVRYASLQDMDRLAADPAGSKLISWQQE